MERLLQRGDPLITYTISFLPEGMTLPIRLIEWKYIDSTSHIHCITYTQHICTGVRLTGLLLHTVVIFMAIVKFCRNVNNNYRYYCPNNSCKNADVTLIFAQLLDYGHWLGLDQICFFPAHFALLLC